MSERERDVSEVMSSESAQEFCPGDRVEFLGGEGNWLPAVVVQYVGVFDLRYGGRPRAGSKMVRLRVGDGVHVVRPVRKCHHVKAEQKEQIA